MVVAHPQVVKLIAAARMKTDSRDTIKLASLLAANLIPAVWVPPPGVRELRALVTHRNRLVQSRGRITKEGRSDLREVMVEAAWVAVEHHPHWKAQFERLAARIGKQKAIVAIARKLLVTSLPCAQPARSGLPCAN